MFLKLTTICDVSHVISFTRPSSPLFFSRGGARRGRPGYEAIDLALRLLFIDLHFFIANWGHSTSMLHTSPSVCNLYVMRSE